MLHLHQMNLHIGRTCALVLEPEQYHHIQKDIDGNVVFPAVTSPRHWVLFHDCYMYGGLTLLDLVKDVVKNYKSDRALIG